MKRDSTVFFLLCTVLSGILAFFVLQNNDFTIQDIGRHLMNGKLLLEGHSEVLYQNTYSYVLPNQQFINHHWLAGVLFYLLHAVGGFRLLSVFIAGVMIAALCFCLDTIRRKSSILMTSIVGLPLTLFLAGRHEIRPEMFGFLLFSLCLWLFARRRSGEFFSKKLILVLCIMQIVWVNVHISFFIQLFLVGAYAIEYVLMKKYTLAKHFFFLFIMLLFCTLLNPNGIFGALAPLSIFHNYGYSIVENQTISFLLPILTDPVVKLYIFTALVSVLFLLATIKKLSFHSIVFACMGILLGYSALRNLPLFALFTLPVLAESGVIFSQWMRRRSMNTYLSLNMLIFVGMVLIYIGTIVFVCLGIYQPNVRLDKLRADTVQNQFASTNFFKNEHVPGPIFNNYDIGSYLIYGLYPEQEVFVDNRPEAYTQEFFQSLYIPMQRQDDVWQKAVETYGFESIFFGHRDATPWAITFLQKRLSDPDWKVIYLDAYAIIFVRNTPEHAELIRAHPIDMSLQ